MKIANTVSELINELVKIEKMYGDMPISIDKGEFDAVDYDKWVSKLTAGVEPVWVPNKRIILY